MALGWPDCQQSDFVVLSIAAAVSCSLVGYMLGGVKMGSGTTGKLGLAWVGAWVVHGWWWGW